jgi:hypothetical protein
MTRRLEAAASVCVASCALLVCATLLLDRTNFMLDMRLEALAASFTAAPACAIPPCAHREMGARGQSTVEEDRLKAMVQGLRSRLSTLNIMMGDWQGKVKNFEKDQRSMLRDLTEKQKKVVRDKQDEENFLATPGPVGQRGPDGWAGRPGPDGAMGPMGPAGFNGYEGQRGPVGPEGRQGWMGPSGQVGELWDYRKLFTIINRFRKNYLMCPCSVLWATTFVT